uniref:Uncharacterized protein n=1 Tax=Anguilla anguilla TaxID=7936 RepID=A0A0E9WVC0_ANGAN
MFVTRCDVMRRTRKEEEEPQGSDWLQGVRILKRRMGGPPLYLSQLEPGVPRVLW